MNKIRKIDNFNQAIYSHNAAQSAQKQIEGENQVFVWTKDIDPPHYADLWMQTQEEDDPTNGLRDEASYLLGLRPN